MVIALNAPAAALAALGALQQISGAQVKAILANGPVRAPSAKWPLGFVVPGAAAGGNGSSYKPWASLDDAAAALVALEAGSQDGNPINLVLAAGTYAANSKPFLRPVNIVMLPGARFATGVVGLPATLPTRTASTVLVTAWGVQRSADGIGNSGNSTDPLSTGVPPFVFTVNTPSLYLGSSITYRGNPPSLGGTDAIMRAQTVVPSGWSLALANVNASAGVSAAGATVVAENSALGADGVGDVAAASLTVTGGSVGGDVTVTTSASCKDCDLTFCTAWTGPLRTDTLGWRGLQNAAVTPSGAKAFFPGTVVTDRVVTAASPMTITLPGTFASAVDAVISPEVADATTFYAVTSTTTTTIVVTFGGTAPVAFRFMAQG